MSLYHPSMRIWDKPVVSVWEEDRALLPSPASPALQSDETADVAIIGGGYCGLSAAYHLSRKDISVRVLEAGAIGWGASGRNGGFCSIGASFLGASDLKDRYGEVETLAFYRTLIDAVRLVEELAATDSIDLRAQQPGVWTYAHRPSRLGELEAQAAACRALGVPSRMVSPDEFSANAFVDRKQCGALFEPVGFGLHPLAFCLGLAAAASRRGATLHAHSRVTAWTRANGRHRLRTPGGSVEARRVIVATNGWLPEDLVPELAGRMLPIMSNIITTAPITLEQWNAAGFGSTAPAADTRAHLTYLRRLPDQRLLFGGRGDTTGHPNGLVAMRCLLERRRADQFPALSGVQTSHAWRGLISATRRLTPAVGTLPSDPSVGYAFGCHGNGVAFMTWAGRALASLMSGERVALPAPLAGLPPRFPLPQLRLWYLRAMLLRAKIDDERD